MIITMTLNWNGEHLLKKLIPSLLRNVDNIEDDVKIVVRDNGSKDNSINYLKDFPIEVLDVGHNRDSFAKGMNDTFNSIINNIEDEGVREYTVLFLNNDIEFISDTALKEMLDVMKKHDAAMVGARLMYENNTISHNGVIFSQRYGNLPWHHRDKCKVESYDKKNKLFQAVTAACCFIKVGDFWDAGKFDEKFFWMYEDIDLCLNISKKLKRKIICCGGPEIVHITSASLKKNSLNRLFLEKNLQRFKQKWSGKYEIDHDKYLNDINYNTV